MLAMQASLAHSLAPFALATGMEIKYIIIGPLDVVKYEIITENYENENWNLSCLA